MGYHFKLSLAGYSYRQYLTGKSPKLDLFDFVNLAADMALSIGAPRRSPEAIFLFEAE
jgi:hypothetical protein